MRIKQDSIPPVEMNICSFINRRLDDLDKLMVKYTGEDSTITSGSEKDAPHKKGSKHFSKPKGEAIDVRNWLVVLLSNIGKKAFFSKLNEIFPPALFDIVEHITHIHIEFDPRMVSETIKIRLRKRTGILKIRKAPITTMPMPTLKLESTFRQVINKSYDVVKVTSNIVGRHYAGVTLFKKKEGEENEGMVDIIRRILRAILNKIRRQ